jgi:hypothetical protein
MSCFGDWLFFWKKIGSKADGGEQVVVDAEIAGKETLYVQK